ncbi:hypothetical protein D3C73_884250 [compost metagenome]
MDRRELLFYTLDHFIAILTLQHHHHTTHGIHFPIICQGTIPDRMSKTHIGYIFDIDRYSTGFFNRDILHILQRRSQSNATNEVCVRFFVNISTTGILIIFLQCGENFRNGDIHRLKAIRVNSDLILFQFTTKAIDLSDTGCTVKLARNDPVLHGP